MDTPVNTSARRILPHAAEFSSATSITNHHRNLVRLLFKRIERQLKLVFILSVALCLAILSIISYIVIRRNSIRNILQLSSQYTVEQQNNFKLHLIPIERNTQNLLHDPSIKTRLRSSLDNSELDIATITQLTSVQSSNLDITAITLFNSDGLYRQSQANRMEPYTPPPLEQLLANPVLDGFVHSKQQAIWFTRHKGNSNPADIIYYYRLQRGVYTLVLKVNDTAKLKGQYFLGQGTIGLLLIDIDLSTVFTKIFYNTSGIETYIVTSDDTILDFGESNINSIRANKYDIISKNKINRGPFIAKGRQKIFSITKSPISSDRIVLAIPLSTINRQLLLMALLLILINGGLIVMAAFVGSVAARSIVEPLTNLYQKMKS